MIYAVLLNPALDVWYDVGELQLGVTRLDVPAQIHPAGKGLNVAKVIGALGDDVCVVGPMPANSDRQFAGYCEDLGVETAFYPVEGIARVNATIIEKQVSQVTHLNSVGPALSVRIQDEFSRYLESRLSEADTWVFSGSVPGGFEADFYQRAIDLCRAKGVRTVLDTRGEPLTMGVRARPDMVKPNLSELEAYFGEQIRGVRHIALKGKRLLDVGIGQVFISLGSDGMIAVHQNECLLCSPPAVDVVDTVGCGDALVAGLTVGQARGFSFAEMCRMAVACGVSNAMHPGPGSVDRDEVADLMPRVTIEAV